jgi:hypothetical protein
MPSIAPRDRAKRDLSSGLLMPITPISSRRHRARYEQRPPTPEPKRRNKGMKEEEKEEEEVKKVESFLGKFKG